MSSENMWEWIVSTYPCGPPPQWWNGLLKTSELSIAEPNVTSSEQRRKFFQHGLRVLRFAVSLGAITGASGVGQLLRLAYMATRLDQELPGLPAILVPDGAVRCALDIIPISQARAMELGNQRQVGLRSAGEESCSGPNFLLEPWQQPDKRDAVLREIGLILEGIALLLDSVEDAQLRREAESWLDIQDRL